MIKFIWHYQFVPGKQKKIFPFLAVSFRDNLHTFTRSFPSNNKWWCDNVMRMTNVFQDRKFRIRKGDNGIKNLFRFQDCSNHHEAAANPKDCRQKTSLCDRQILDIILYSYGLECYRRLKLGLFLLK